MLIGYSIIAVPTGVFSAQVIRSIREDRYSEEACPGCGHDRHEKRARYCLRCGTWLDEDSEDPRKKAQKKRTTLTMTHQASRSAHAEMGAPSAPSYDTFSIRLETG
ncbi:hypothetical protein DK37_23275 [Halomonas sp. SUBG004]|nr:hypothetical protein DK37_23275 [Halomonas sp. SUBG004]